MSRQRSVLVLLVVPAVVSLAVTLLILTFWDRQQEPEYIMLPTHSGTAQIPPRETRPPVEAAEIGEEGEPAEPAGGDEEPAPTIEPGCENPIHTVASGETLGAIAEQYGVSIDEITEMNLLVDPTFNPNVLAIDQQLVIPTCGIPTATPTLEPTSTTVPTRNVPTANPTGTQAPLGVVVVEIARVLNPGEVTAEAVEVINRGSSVARLGGWTLYNERNDAEFEFPPLNLFPQGAITVYTGAGENSAIDVYWGRDASAWAPGDTVQLYNADGDLQFEFDIPEN